MYVLIKVLIYLIEKYQSIIKIAENRVQKLTNNESK